MTLLLDTHAFLWFCQDDPALSAAAKAAIEDPASRKVVSLASCWELAIKAGLGKLKLGEPSASYIPNALARTGFELLDRHHARPRRGRRDAAAASQRPLRQAPDRPGPDRRHSHRQRGRGL